jgi:hypothetical protein
MGSIFPCSVYASVIETASALKRYTKNGRSSSSHADPKRMPSGGLFLPIVSFAQSEGRGAQRSEHCDLRAATNSARAWALSVCRTQEVRISASPQQHTHRHVFQGFLVRFCLTLKMSEPAGWRASCVSTRRDRQSGSLHRFVRLIFSFHFCSIRANSCIA